MTMIERLRSYYNEKGYTDRSELPAVVVLVSDEGVTVAHSSRHDIGGLLPNAPGVLGALLETTEYCPFEEARTNG